LSSIREYAKLSIDSFLYRLCRHAITDLDVRRCISTFRFLEMKNIKRHFNLSDIQIYALHLLIIVSLGFIATLGTVLTKQVKKNDIRKKRNR
jgi:hypothetical protein